jgi:hypothetical protein
MGSDVDLLVLNPNGTIEVSMDKTYKLRRPKFGELRTLWEAWDQAIEVHNGLIDTAEGGKETAATRAERAQAWLDFQRLTFATIGDAELPADDEVDGWLLTATVGSQMLVHWQTVPKASG